MESTSAAMQIHISQGTKDLLPDEYKTSERGEITVKGKGMSFISLMEIKGSRFTKTKF
jgi:hypothetical protein